MKVFWMLLVFASPLTIQGNAVSETKPTLTKSYSQISLRSLNPMSQVSELILAYQKAKKKPLPIPMDRRFFDGKTPYEILAYFRLPVEERIGVSVIDSLNHFPKCNSIPEEIIRADQEKYLSDFEVEFIEPQSIQVPVRFRKIDPDNPHQIQGQDRLIEVPSYTAQKRTLQTPPCILGALSKGLQSIRLTGAFGYSSNRYISFKYKFKHKEQDKRLKVTFSAIDNGWSIQEVDKD